MSNCPLLKDKDTARKEAVGCAVNLGSGSMKPKHSTLTKQEFPQKRGETEKVSENFEPFVLEGVVSLGDDKNQQPIKIMRDTGCAQSMILARTLPFDENSSTGLSALIQGVGMEIINIPLHEIDLKSDLVSGRLSVGVRSELPVKGVSMLLGNDLAGGKVLPYPIVVDKPCFKDIEETEENEMFPACVVTRAMSKKASLKTSEDSHSQSDDTVFDLENTFLTKVDEKEGKFVTQGDKKTPEHKPVSEHDQFRETDPLSHDKLVAEQEKDPELKDLGQRALSPQEAEQNPVCFYKQNGVLMRKWRPPNTPANDEWKIVHQIVVPRVYRDEVISIAHNSPMAGHLGVRKTHDRIIQLFWWPTLRKYISEHCKTCHTCQVVGKSNQKIPPAPLKPIPAFNEPFSRVIIDCEGPLPKTKAGNEYLLTIMCAVTRFPEAIPLRNIKW